jgi:hypothetical protein
VVLRNVVVASAVRRPVRVGLSQPPAVHVHGAVSNRDAVTGHSHNALDEETTRAALTSCLRTNPESHDLAPLNLSLVLDDDFILL